MKPLSKNAITTLLAALLIIATILVLRLPLSRDREAIIPAGNQAPVATLEPGDTITQTLRAAEGTIAGFIVYSPQATIPSHALRATFYTPNQPPVESFIARTEYRDNLARFIFNLPTRTPEPKADLRVQLTNVSGHPIPLTITDHDAYPGGSVDINGEEQTDADLSLSLLYTAPTNPATQYGAAVGLLVLIGAIILTRTPKYQWRTAATIAIVTTFLATTGFWINGDLWGQSDWNLYFSTYESYRQISQDYNSFPLWDPFTYGGMTGIGDPEFSVFSLTFIPILLFGTITGFKVAISLSILISTIGTVLLAKQLKLSPLAGLLIATSYPISATILLKFVEGHIQHLATAWIPWIFWAWLKAYQANSKHEARNPKQILNTNAQNTRPSVLNFGHSNLFSISNLGFRISPLNRWSLQTTHYSLLTGLFLALTFFQGGIYMLFYIIPALIILPLLTCHIPKAALVTIAAGIWSFGLSAVKVLPVIHWIRQFPDDFYHVSANTIPYWVDLFLRRHLHDSVIIPGQKVGWHEYGSYIGPVILLLATLALVKIKTNKFVKVLLIGATLSFLTAAAGPALEPVFDIITWLPRSNISRIALFTVFSLVLLAGFGLDALYKNRRRSLQALAPIVVGLVAIDLMSFALPLSQQTFIVPPVTPEVQAAAAPVQYTANPSTVRVRGTDEDRTFAWTKQGYGQLTYRPPIAPPLGVIPVQHDHHQYLASTSDDTEMELIAWHPNRIEVAVQATQPTDVIINSNFATGWSVNGVPAQEIKNRLGTRIPPGTHQLTFTYHPPGLRLGAFITLLTLGALIFMVARGALTQSPGVLIC